MHRCTRVGKVHVINRSVSSEMLTISSRMACLSAFKPTGLLLYTLLFKKPHQKNQVLFGPANEEAVTQDRHEKSPAAETKSEAQPC